MSHNMCDYSSTVSTYYPSGNDRIDENYYTHYTPQHVTNEDRYFTDEWNTSSTDYPSKDARERTESFEERTRTIRPDDYYDDRNRLYRTAEERYSGRSTRSARSDADHNWYQSDPLRSSKNYSTIRRCQPETSSYRAKCDTLRKDEFDTSNERTLRAEERDWYYDQTKKLSSGKIDNNNLNRSGVNSNDKVNELYNNKDDLEQNLSSGMCNVGTGQVISLQKKDNSCCGFLGNQDNAVNNRTSSVPVPSYGVLDKNKRVVVGVASPRSEAPGSSLGGCCKPVIFLLFVVLVLLVFALVAGLLLYFNYMNFKPKATLVDEPCEKTFCRWGAVCVVSDDGRTHCQCPTECNDSPHSGYVCGSDNKTYRTSCDLRREACEKRQNIRVIHDGQCEISDPCRDVQCEFGARCQPSFDGRSASCKCPESCPRYGDHAGSRPVCGTDGQDYKDHCEMRKAACDTKTNITVKYLGKCDPCTGVACPEPEQCQLDVNRVAVCKCAEACPIEFVPVCGSDGKTYSNECHLRREGCRTRRQLRIIYRGQCSSGVNPCESVKCLPDEECTINKFGIAKCECGPECEPVMRPVCSVDGRTFSSECDLKQAACHAKMPIVIAHPGVCGERGPCQGRSCQWGATCVERGGQASCECPHCSSEFDPVCGSDGISYGNECKLRHEACKYKREVTVLYKGPCNGCENKRCDFYSVCESEGSEAKCVCPRRCEEGTEYGDVCGSDSQTYASECQLRAKACSEQINLTVQYKGDCGTCKDVQCKNGARCVSGECVCPQECSSSDAEPVCANTMVTYASECELQKAACEAKPGSPPLNVIFYGDCRERFALIAGLSTLQPGYNTAIAENEIAHGPTEYPEKSWTSLEKEACKDIHCDYEATCELGPDNFPRCSCLFDCATVANKGNAKPVCASDFRIYPSMCAMKLEACQRQEELRLRPLELCQGLEVKPCNGETPLTDPLTGLDLDCGSGPHRKDCPSGSYCHQTTKVARCCKKDKVQEEKKSCEDSWYGCCSDNTTPAQGPDYAGCPSLCNCNKLGSFSETCNPETQQCDCRPGVGGLKCDRCEPGYWGLPKISSGHQGCIPCGCSMFGSVREDCEQMTGRCVCKPGIQGQKCTICTSHDKILGPNGCFSPDAINLPPTQCKDLNCYFGAMCIERSGLAVCECASTQCPPESMDTLMVCGSDGQTYTSECHLRLQACRTQTDIVVKAFGICREETFDGTDWPIRRYTPMHYTQPEEGQVHLSKSTRHLLVPDPKYLTPYDENENLMTYHKTALGAEIALDVNNYLGKGKTNGEGSKTNFPSRTTLGTITALIGDLCVTNIECQILNTHCVKGACVCSDDYRPSTNRQECFGPTNSPQVKQITPCDRSPCHYSSTCVNLPDGGFTCICMPPATGRLCEFRITVQHFDVPSFDGHAYIIMKSLSAYHKFHIELEFTTFSDNGILLYNQQKVDGSGDFVSIAIVNGHIEMRYNLGDGIVSVVTPEAVHMNERHRLTAKRYHRDGMLKLDDGEDIVGQSRGVLKALDLVEQAYIGFVPSNYTRVFENIGIRQGFIGCIHRLKIGRILVYPRPSVYSESSLNIELASHSYRESSGDVVYDARNVRECSDNPCASMPCANGGTCHALDREFYRCACLDGFIGDFCDTVLDPCSSSPCENSTTCVPEGISFRCMCMKDDDIIEDCTADKSKKEPTPIPQFSGSSYIQLPKPYGLGKSFKMEIWFLAKKNTGLLLYCAQFNSRSKGDFVSVNLVKGRVQFRFNLGSGIASITTTDTIQLETWHRIKIRRTGREGAIQLDNSTITRGSTAGVLSELNLEQPLYLGFVPSSVKTHRLAGITSGFLGAMQRVMINGKSLKILNHNSICTSTGQHISASKGRQVSCSSPGVTKYSGPPCFKETCSGNGFCIPVLNDFHCQCDEGYTGENCEQKKVMINYENDIEIKRFPQGFSKNKQRLLNV